MSEHDDDRDQGPAARPQSGPTRRQVLGLLAGTAAGAAVGCTDTGDGRAASASAPATTRPRTTAPPRTTPPSPAAADHALVVIELPGGNDGLTMVHPARNGRYRDARPTTSLGDADVVAFDQDMLLNAQLAPLADRGLAIVDGIGARTPGLSHFDMSARWWAGTPDSDTPLRTGFLGRVCDVLGEPESLTGVTVDVVASTSLQCERHTTTGRPDSAPIAPILGGGPAAGAALRRALDTMGTSTGRHGLGREAAAGMRRMEAVADDLADLAPRADGYPTGDGTDTQVQMADLAGKLSFASQLLRSDLGVRVVHIRAERLFFDTHERHLWAHRRCLDVVIPNIVAFYDDLARAGLTDKVLVATTSEFGRRLAEHQGGLDHGTASCGLMLGPVRPGLHGEPAALDRLDRDGNLVATNSFNRYYATMAEWLGVDPTDVLASHHRPIEGVLA